tara:strand:- start:10053 stop:10280 length:228 start_codon:yes stop_codon:yes gene_type:complete
MKKKKTPTNDQAFKNLLKDLHPLHVALLRERVLKIMDMTIEDIENNPDNWKNPFIHPESFVGLNEQVKKHLGFDN